MQGTVDGPWRVEFAALQVSVYEGKFGRTVVERGELLGRAEAGWRGGTLDDPIP